MLPVFALLSFLLGASAFAETSSRVALTPRLAQWKAEIEATGKTTVVIARVFTDAARNELRLPEDAAFRPALTKLLSSEPFVALFVQTHAMNANLHTGIRPISVVLLNMARAGDWDGEEEAVVAHEFGHIWLHVTGYPAPNTMGHLTCDTVHAGDIVQHVLIREQLRERQIDFLPFWIRTLDQARLRIDEQPAAPDRCGTVALLALWIDVSLGITAKEWPGRDAFIVELEKKVPGLKPRVLTMLQILRAANLHDRRAYQKVLRTVLEEIHEIRN